MSTPPGYTPEELATKLPPPPDATVLQARLRSEDIVTMSAGMRFWHIYKRGGAYPVQWSDFRHFGPIDARYDHHQPPSRVQARGILYLATRIGTCVTEVFQATRDIDRTHNLPWLAAHEATRDVIVLDLTQAWPTRTGASMVINDGPRAITRQWSAAIYDAYPHVDGLLYASSMYKHEPCIALYERGRDSLPRHPSLDRALSDPGLFDTLAAVADDMGYTLA